MDLTPLLEGMPTGITAGAVVVIASSVWWRDRERRQDRTEERVDVLEEQRVAGLERRFEEMEKGCASRHETLNSELRALTEVRQDLANAVGWLKKVDLTVQELNRTLGAIQAELGARVEWIRNLNTDHVQLRHDLAEHLKERDAHHG